MPTTATSTWSEANRLDALYEADKADVQHIMFAATQTLAKGTVMGEVTATPGTFRAYASGNVDGSQVAKCILQYACTVDGAGLVTINGEWGQTSKSAPAYIGGGFFKTAELTGLDAGAVTNLGGSLVSGTVTAGIFRFG